MMLLLSGFIALFTSLTTQAHAGFDPCEALFLSSHVSHGELVLKARARAQERGVQAADFFDMNAATRAARSWRGVKAPEILKGAFPPGISLVSHELFKSNEGGLVKFNTLGFGTVRAQVHFEGKSVGTNVGVRTRTLVDVLKGESKTLVSSKAKAVLIFMHGGGTTTTGHHVAIQIASYLEKFGIEVISFDQLWHAEGPRMEFRDARHYFEYVRAFLKEYVEPSGVPIFLGGHSMGGLFADMYMRHFPKDDLVKGAVALSAVPDMAPGGTLYEKLLATKDLDNIPADMMSKLAEDDAGTGEGLLKQGKLTPLAEIFEGEFMIANDWSIPEHAGKDYIPALFVWGSGDWLYVGKEKLIKDKIGALSNVTLKIYEERVTTAEVNSAVKAKSDPGTQKIGHLIFDHYPANVSTVAEAREANLEAYQDVRNFIQNVLGKDLPKNEDKSAEQPKDQFLLNFLANYTNNLAFREFMEQATLQIKSAPDAIKGLQSLVFNGRKLQTMIQGAKDPDSIPKWQAELDAIKMEMFEKTGIYDLEEVAARFTAEWAPPGPAGDWGRELLIEKKNLLNQSRELDGQIKRARKALEPAKQLWTRMQAHFAEQVRIHFETERTPRIGQAWAEQKQAFEALKIAYETVNLRITEYRAKAYSQGKDIQKNPHRSVRPWLHLYKQALDRYIAIEAQLPELMQQEAKDGHAGAELLDLAAKLEIAHSDFEVLRKETEQLELQYAQTSVQIRALERALIEKYEDRFLTIKTVHAKDLLNLPFSEFANVQNLLLQFWADWKTIYKDRPEVSGAPSLY